MRRAGDWSSLAATRSHAGSLNAMRSAMCGGSELLGWLHRQAVQAVSGAPVCLLDVLLKLRALDAPLVAAANLNGPKLTAAHQGIGLGGGDVQFFRYLVLLIRCPPRS